MGYHDGPMRLASIRIDGNEVAAVVWAGGALPVAEIPDPAGWPTDLFSLLEGGRLEDLRRTWDAFSERELEDLPDGPYRLKVSPTRRCTVGRARSGA